MSGIAPAAANKLQRVSKHFSYLKSKASTSSPEYKDFKVLNNFPFFVNVNIQISRASSGEDREAATPSQLRPVPRRGHLQPVLSRVEVSVRLEVMMAKHRSEVDHEGSHGQSQSQGEAQAQASYNKFMSLIRNKQLAEHHDRADVASVQADTDAGFHAFVMTRHEATVADLECLVHALTQQACVSVPMSGPETVEGLDSTSDLDSSLHCSIDDSDIDPRMVLSTTMQSVWNKLKVKIVVEPRLVIIYFLLFVMIIYSFQCVYIVRM